MRRATAMATSPPGKTASSRTDVRRGDSSTHRRSSGRGRAHGQARHSRKSPSARPGCETPAAVWQNAKDSAATSYCTKTSHRLPRKPYEGRRRSFSLRELCGIPKVRISVPASFECSAPKCILDSLSQTFTNVLPWQPGLRKKCFVRGSRSTAGGYYPRQEPSQRGPRGSPTSPQPSAVLLSWE